MTAISILLAVILDLVFSEPKRFHPLVGFGNMANALEKRLNQAAFSPSLQQLLGMMSWLVIVLIPTLVLLLASAYLQQSIGFSWLIEAIVVYLAIGHSSLRQHALVVFEALKTDNIILAREKVAWIVSRDTSALDEVGVRRATIESVLENGSDAVFAPLFWFCVGGIPAVVVYRLANTLDAMWGYKNERFLFFGRFSARMDDILNYLPSRLVAISYALFGQTRSAIQCWRNQSQGLASPSGGVVMTAGAGTLHILLGGDTYYHGKKMQKPLFGCGEIPQNQDIMRSIYLIDKTLGLWCILITVYSLVQWLR